MLLTDKTVIVIPIYNGEEFIERSLQSCLVQTVKTVIWVVDNSSTDNTQKVVKKYQEKFENVKLLVNEKNLGRVGNWNRCLDLFEKSNYQYIKWLFAGDELFPECVEECEKVFALDSEIGAIAFPYEFINKKGLSSVGKDYCGNRLFDVKEINIINIEKGGLLGAIVCNAYNRKFINGYRFSEFFIGKVDFDYKILSISKGYYLDKVLARFNLDAHRTFQKALDYITETEFVFNRAYWLEKMKNLFTDAEYKKMREVIFIEFFERNKNYYKNSTFIKLLFLNIKIIIWKLYVDFKNLIKKIIKYEN